MDAATDSAGLRPAAGTKLARHIRVLLIAFPLLYLLHSFAPHTRQLFVDDDHSRFWAFWSVIAVLHWASAALAWGIMRRHGLSLASIGVQESRRQLLRLLMILVAVGLAVLATRTGLGRIDLLGAETPVFGIAGPATTLERLAWIFIALTAGICEEFVYRGLGIGAQRRAGVTIGVALTWSTLAFIFLHGLSAFALFPVYAAMGLAMAFIYLRTGKLTAAIATHSAIDLLVILVS